MVTFELGITTGTLGRQLEAMDVVTFGQGIMAGTHLESILAHAWEATGGNGFGNFRGGNHHWDALRRQREAMDLVIFRLLINTETRLGSNGRQWIWSGHFQTGNHWNH